MSGVPTTGTTRGGAVPELLEQGQLQAGRSFEASVQRVPGRADRRSHELGTSSDQAIGRSLDIRDLERHTYARTDAPTDLNGVDHVDLIRIREFESGPADIEDRHLRTVCAVHLQLLRRSQDVPIEPDRLFVVVDLHNQAHLQYARLLIGSASHRFRPSQFRDRGWLPNASWHLCPCARTA